MRKRDSNTGRNRHPGALRRRAEQLFWALIGVAFFFALLNQPGPSLGRFADGAISKPGIEALVPSESGEAPPGSKPPGSGPSGLESPRSESPGSEPRGDKAPPEDGEDRRAGEDESKALVPPETSAPSVLLMDRISGALLVTKEAHAARPAGSLTKLPGALVLFERNELDEMVRVSSEAARSYGFTLNLNEGEEVLLKNLLYLMFYRSGNDGIAALAEHVAGSVGAFVDAMNVEARRVGAGGSRFQNAYGLDEPGHVSTAYDLAMVAKAALEYPGFVEMAKGKRARLAWRGRVQDVLNFNSFLWRYPGAEGIVTAYTPESGHSLVGLAKREDRELLVVVLGAATAEDRYRDAARLLDFGFQHFEALHREPVVHHIRYTVRSGDTLSSLARKYAVPIAAIRRANGLDDPDSLQAGQEIRIPR